MSSSESSRRFHFIREIASGGFGSVYLTKVIHADGFSRLVAVKLLHPRWSENEEIASRMRDEARLLGWLRHKNIVDVMDLTLIDGRCAVIMEYLEAVDTKVLINHCAQTGARVPIRAALEICAAVASALDAAYNRPPYAGEKPLRVIHRDIKPSNIMVDDSGVVKVLDFGVARAEFDERESKTQEMAFGSLEYMPPERLFFEPESPASDVYSLGATLYEMLALEKFGKAKLRPKEHEQFFEDRFDLLLDRYPLHDEAEKLLHELLMDMLEFDEPERPTAADCVARMRAFARRIPEHPLEEWAESVVPTLLRDTRDREDAASPGSLVGTVLVEDARALDQRSIWDENTGMSTRAMDISNLDDEMTGSLADDARWKALKQATIEEMAKKGELGPVRPPRAEPPRPPEVKSVEQRPGLSTTGTPPPARQKSPPPPPVSATPTPAPTQRFKVPPELRQYNRPQTDPMPKAETARKPPDPPPPPPSRPSSKKKPARRGGMLATVALMFMLGAGLGLIVFALIVFLVAIGMMTTQTAAPPAPISLPEPPPPPAPANPEPIEGPHAKFSSGRANTEKLKVSCSNASGDGVDVAIVPAGEALGTCRVQAITGDGKRLSTRIEDAEPREYLCFVGDSEECK
ncbi:MAG: serine/threonine protein kinase [Alphaproteobacteria bacterium]|nr:serine/threonine protein kinase [Alphaproteobacteria bacterium]